MMYTLILTVAILTSTLGIYQHILIVSGENVTSRVVKEYSDEDYDIEGVMNMCNESFRTEMSYLESLNETGSFPDETDKTPKCYIRCVLENVDIVSEEGIFDPELTAIIFAGERDGKPMNDLRDMAAFCAQRNETCKCERSYNFIKCLMTMEIKKYSINSK